MRKRVFGKKLGRNTNSREALYRSIMRSLIHNGSISTTKAKAQAVMPEVDKLMKHVRVDSVDSRRKVLAVLGNDRKTADTLISRYQSLATDRASGFLTMTHLPPRRGDNAPAVRLSWVSVETKVNSEKESNKSEK